MSIKDESRLRMVSYLEKIGYIKNESVKNAFLKVDRSMFVHEASKDEAYKDTPLSIGWGQTISCLLYTSPSPRDRTRDRMPPSA